MSCRRCQIALDAPGLTELDYLVPEGLDLAVGDWVVVPLGQRQMVGLVVGLGAADDTPIEGLKAVLSGCSSLPRLAQAQLDLVQFASAYYLRTVGQTAATMLPTWLKQPKVHQPNAQGRQLAEALLKKLEPAQPTTNSDAAPGPVLPPLTAQQADALAALRAATVPVLLQGVTGSGKTRVYIERIADVLSAEHDGQVLVLVPEIGLTPAMARRLQEAFPQEQVAVIHSNMTDRERAKAWLAAVHGRARILVGTRTAIWCPLPKLRLLVVDEEHDTSYKQQEGLRYHARDLAVWRATTQQVPLILGSATPSLESRAQLQRGRYQRLMLTQQASGARRAPVQLVDLLVYRPERALAAPVRAAIDAALAARQQVLIFVNRRGWAPVLSCEACGWRQACRDCAAPAVLHRRPQGWRLICHHCGLQTTPPRACPDCGAPELVPIGKGSQQIEAEIADCFPGARVARLDRDAASRADQLEDTLAQLAAGEIDILVGTQMVAKGHDFPALKLVVVLDADAQLANPDFRAPEQLFSTLIQVAGRAGRHQHEGLPAQVLIQTRAPAHPLFQALQAGTQAALEAAWQTLLDERQAAGMPPFGHLALVRAAHRESSVAQQALEGLQRQLSEQAQALGLEVVVYPPVPRYPERVANKTRWQLVLESNQRPHLRRLLVEARLWCEANRKVDAQIEVDPLGLT